MAVWQVDFHIVPRSAIAASPQLLTAAVLNGTDWWSNAKFPADYRTRLATVAPAVHSRAAALESWGEEDGNRFDVWSENGRVIRAIVRVDVRRLDSKAGAALLFFVRAANALLVRIDGLVVEPSITSYVGALRSAPAWRYANDPADFLARQAPIDDGPE